MHQTGDIVLLKEKNTSRLDWPTGSITSVTTDKDGLVRRVYVQPHKKQGQVSAPQLKERAIHDLVLIKSITAKDNPYQDSTTIKTAPSEAKILKCSVTTEDRKMFWNDPMESTKLGFSKNITSPISPDDTQHVLSPTEEEISNLQQTAVALLEKIQSLRQNDEKHDLDPKAPPFIPQMTILATAQIHNQPKTKPSTSKELKNMKSLRWCPQLIEVHEIKATGYQYPTKLIKEEICHWTTKRNRETKRTKRHRNQVIDVVTMMFQLDAWNRRTFPRCPSPNVLFKM